MFLNSDSTFLFIPFLNILTIQKQQILFSFYSICVLKRQTELKLSKEELHDFQFKISTTQLKQLSMLLLCNVNKVVLFQINLCVFVLSFFYYIWVCGTWGISGKAYRQLVIIIYSYNWVTHYDIIITSS